MRRELKFRAWDKAEKKWIDGAYGFHILGENMILSGMFQERTWDQLNAVEITQFTGLLDRQDSEIWEADIVEPGQDVCWKTGEVRYDHGAFRVHAFLLCQLSRCHVVGNLYENPELLESPND